MNVSFLRKLSVLALLVVVSFMATACENRAELKEEYGPSAKAAVRSVQTSYNILLWISIGLAALTALIAAALVVNKIITYADPHDLEQSVGRGEGDPQEPDPSGALYR